LPLLNHPTDITEAHHQDTIVNGKPTALITGAASDLGAAFAHVFARHGYDLVLIARTAAPLNHLAEQLTMKFQASVKILLHDLSHPNAPDTIAAQLQQTGIEVQILVNTSELGGSGAFVETDATAEWQLMQINMVALTQLTKVLLPGMMRRGTGKILNVASLAAFQPVVLRAVYEATQAYILSFSEALAAELRGTGVTVTAFCPQRQDHQPPNGSDSERESQCTAAAKLGYQALFAGRTVAIPGWKNRCFAVVATLLPRRWTGAIASLLTPNPATPPTDRP
jgi:short-subunit dehydrogenase